MRVGSNIESFWKNFIHYIVNGYILKTVKDIGMRSLDAYNECYGQNIWYIRFVPGVMPNPQVWKKITWYFKAVDIPTPKPYIFLFLCNEASYGI